MLLNFSCVYFFPLVDVEAVILQFLLQNIRDVDVNMDDLLLTFLLHINIWLNPLKQVQCFLLQDITMEWPFSNCTGQVTANRSIEM